ncbi:DUF6318 family protein [uncultured Actinomyces sp.]|uniref:DUF6318 family protein n=1 Tax=uncultured Actinomyces sp. TaxID=249061 RepID=UPI0034449ACC
MTEEDEEQFRRESMPRTYTLRQRWADYRAEVRANRPKGAKARVRAWLHVEPFYWGMRAAYVVLVVGAVFAVYINGVANGWWHAWGEKPTVAATTPAARPAPSASSPTDAAMSGGYQIGPDGVLVRPAEHAASTYTKPELPEEAKENTERGAELAAEHAFSLLIYAWNTGDTQPFADITQSGDGFRETYIDKVKKSYASGWTYGMHSSITRIVKVEPVSEQKWGAQPNTIGVQFKTVTSNGVTCVNQKISTDESEYRSSVTLFMTWKNEHWVVTDGDISNDK